MAEMKQFRLYRLPLNALAQNFELGMVRRRLKLIVQFYYLIADARGDPKDLNIMGDSLFDSVSQKGAVLFTSQRIAVSISQNFGGIPTYNSPDFDLVCGNREWNCPDVSSYEPVHCQRRESSWWCGTFEHPNCSSVLRPALDWRRLLEVVPTDQRRCWQRFLRFHEASWQAVHSSLRCEARWAPSIYWQIRLALAARRLRPFEKSASSLTIKVVHSAFQCPESGTILFLAFYPSV